MGIWTWTAEGKVKMAAALIYGKVTVMPQPP